MTKNRSISWSFNGTPGDFIGMIMWSCIAREGERDPDVIDVLTEPDKVMEYAQSRGITAESVAREAVRLGQLYLDYCESPSLETIIPMISL